MQRPVKPASLTNASNPNAFAALQISAASASSPTSRCNTVFSRSEKARTRCNRCRSHSQAPARSRRSATARRSAPQARKPSRHAGGRECARLASARSRARRSGSTRTRYRQRAQLATTAARPRNQTRRSAVTRFAISSRTVASRTSSQCSRENSRARCRSRSREILERRREKIPSCQRSSSRGNACPAPGAWPGLRVLLLGIQVKSSVSCWMSTEPSSCANQRTPLGGT